MLARFIVLTFLTLGAPQLAAAQAATAQDYSAAVKLTQKACLQTFPDFRRAVPMLAATGFDDRNKYGWVKGNLNIHAGFSGPNKTQTCSISLRTNSNTRDMSDALQSSLAALPIKITSAKRKGVRLTVEFNKNGTDGTMLVKALGGFSSGINVRVKP